MKVEMVVKGVWTVKPQMMVAQSETGSTCCFFGHSITSLFILNYICFFFMLPASALYSIIQSDFIIVLLAYFKPIYLLNKTPQSHSLHIQTYINCLITC